MRSIHLRVPSAERCSVTISGTSIVAISLELGAELLLQIAHGGKIRGALSIDPFHQLPGAERLCAETLGDERLQLLPGQAEKIYAIGGHLDALSLNEVSRIR